MFLNLLAGPFDIFACAMSSPTSGSGSDQDGRREERKQYTFDHMFLSFPG